MNFFRRKKILKIRTYGDPVLRKKAEPVVKVDESITELADAMIDTMFESDGVGLAAPQIGESIRMIALGVPYDREKRPLSSPGEVQLLPQMPVVLINPEVTPVTDQVVSAEEGCLSIPNVFAKVARPPHIMLSAELLDGRRINAECRGFLARALQHEVDHLNGTLFIDHIDEEESRRIAPQLEIINRKKGSRK